jgi:hypothetical protein
MAAPLETTAERDTASLEAFVAAYRPLPGIFDEMMDDGGGVRPHWRSFLGMLAALGPDEINRRFAAADRYLRSSGVFYRVYEDAAGIERPWPLSHVPLMIEPTEWRALEAGLVQRAELLEAVLADAYGPSHLTRDGHLPATVIAGNPEFLRPLVGVAPPGGAHLRFYTVDVARGADGRWWVLGDRAQAPSGAGYAIENRLALSRIEVQRASGLLPSRDLPAARDLVEENTQRERPRLQAPVAPDRHARQRHGFLRHIIDAAAADRADQRLALGVIKLRAQHAGFATVVDVRFEGRRDNQAIEFFDGLFPHVGLTEPPGRDIRDGEVIAKDAARESRQEGQHSARFDEAGAERIHDNDLAVAHGLQKTRCAEP